MCSASYRVKYVIQGNVLSPLFKKLFDQIYLFTNKVKFYILFKYKYLRDFIGFYYLFRSKNLFSKFPVTSIFY